VMGRKAFRPREEDGNPTTCSVANSSRDIIVGTRASLAIGSEGFQVERIQISYESPTVIRMVHVCPWSYQESDASWIVLEPYFHRIID
jgi:hypothetical protein